MRLFISLIILLMGCLTLSAQSAIEYFKVDKPVKYCDTDFYLAWSAHPQANYYVQEYLPEGESLDHYNQMFTISVIFWDRTPLEAVQAKISELEQRKQTDPICNYMVAENNGEYILEFLVSDSNNGKINIVEIDVHYYKQMNINGRNASLLNFYSSRAYGKDISSFIQSIPEKRNNWYTGMSELKIDPEILK